MSKIYAKQTIEDFLSKTKKLENGCIVSNCTTVRVLHDNKIMYVIPALFSYYHRTYNGKIIRTCKNKSCVNIEHLKSLTVSERIWDNILVGDVNDCWEWVGCAGTNNYASTRINGKSIIVTRYVYEEVYGEFDKSLCVCHKCDNPPCCNPNHLFLGTTQDNVNDRESKGRNKMPHSLGENHGNNKLSEDSIQKIRVAYANGGVSYAKLAKEFGVSFGHIRNIVKKKAWKWLEDGSS